MRAFIRGLDWLVRKAYKVYEYTQEPGCILRLQLGKASHPVQIGNQIVEAGEPILYLHLWNEHLPRMPVKGADLAWARNILHLYVSSLKMLAVYIRRNPKLSEIRFISGETSLLNLHGRAGGTESLRKLGFHLHSMKYTRSQFSNFWQNFYAWLLAWTFNPSSLQNKKFTDLYRTEMWMSMEDFIHRFSG